MKDWQAVLLAGVMAIVLIALPVWAWVAGPCQLYQWQKTADVPVRCIAELTHR